MDVMIRRIKSAKFVDDDGIKSQVVAYQIFHQISSNLPHNLHLRSNKIVENG